MKDKFGKLSHSSFLCSGSHQSGNHSYNPGEKQVQHGPGYGSGKGERWMIEEWFRRQNWQDSVVVGLLECQKQVHYIQQEATPCVTERLMLN